MLNFYRNKGILRCIFFFVLLAMSCLTAISTTTSLTTETFISPVLNAAMSPWSILLTVLVATPTRIVTIACPTGIPIARFLPLASAFVPASTDEIQRITPEELKKLIETRADIVIVDNQPKLAYDMGHIKGAINFPWATEIKEEDTFQLPLDKQLILYCACAHEEDSTDVATRLIKNFGYKNIKLLEGGWSKWLKLGYPIEKSR